MAAARQRELPGSIVAAACLFGCRRDGLLADQREQFRLYPDNFGVGQQREVARMR
jgi:hypothetical protein